MPSLRSDALCCFVINCLAVAAMICLFSLQLNTVHPVIIIELDKKNSKPAVDDLLATTSTPYRNTAQMLKGVVLTAANNSNHHIKQEDKTSHFSTTPGTVQFTPRDVELIKSVDTMERKPLLNNSKPQLRTILKYKESENAPNVLKYNENPKPNLLPYKKGYMLKMVNGTYVRVMVKQPPSQAAVYPEPKDGTELQFSTDHDVLPRVAIFDTRHTTRHANSTVILVEVKNTKRTRYNRIIGCGVDDTRALKFKAKPMFIERNWISQLFNLTHAATIVNCYDLPTKNGSKAFVLYRPYLKHGLLKVYSEQPVVMTDLSQPQQPLSIVVCTTVYDKPSWLTQWLKYQQAIGVDYIHLYAQQSFIDKGGMSNPELKKLIAAHKLTVDVRRTYLNSSEIYYYSQPLHYQDCILRYRGVYEFAMLVDTDDFFVPRVPGEPRIQYYLKEMFNRTSIASVRLDWIRYFPSCGLTQPLEEMKDGNITNYLVETEALHEYVKSVHRLSLTLETAIHEIAYMVKGSKISEVSNSTVYIAHIRKTEKCSKKFIEELKETSRFKPKN